LPAGTYTAQVTGNGVTSGTCLIEIYDVSGAGSQLVNLSSLLPIGTRPDLLRLHRLAGTGHPRAVDSGGSDPG